MQITLCVTNDIATDQRINRIARSLKKLTPDILIVGTLGAASLPVSNHTIRTHRIKMIFKKGPMFYVEYNIRLFVLLLFSKTGILVSNDLDTLVAAYIASRIKRIPLVYDSHEYFTELPELVGRKCVRRIWTTMESLILPRIKYAYTVSSSIAQAYTRQYNINMQVIRNLPNKKANPLCNEPVQKEKEKLIIYQGVLNMGRGLELAIRAMQFIEGTRLVIAGSGYFENNLRDLTKSLKLYNKVRFIGRIPPAELVMHTMRADLGISLEEHIGLNYFYALPNKLFDYIQAKIPVLVSDMPEMAFIVKNYDVGMVTDAKDPIVLAHIFREMLDNEQQRLKWQVNLEKAANELCWENEEMKLLAIYQEIMR